MKLNYPTYSNGTGNAGGDGVPAWKQKLLDKGFVEDPKTGAMINPQKAKEMGLTGGDDKKEKVKIKTSEDYGLKADFEKGDLPQTEADRRYLEEKVKKGAATEAERKAFVAYQNVGGRTMEEIEDQAETNRIIITNPELAADAAQLALQGVATSDVPGLSSAAGVLNTIGYGARGLYKAAKGDALGAGTYGSLATGSALGALPVIGTAADAAGYIKLADKIDKGVKAAKSLKPVKFAYDTKKPVGYGKKGVNLYTEAVEPLATGSLTPAMRLGGIVRYR
jgi:hypothetical protein